MTAVIMFIPVTVRQKGDEYSILARCIANVTEAQSSTQSINTVLQSVSSLFGGSPVSLITVQDSDLQVVASSDTTGRGSIVGARYSAANSITGNVAFSGATARRNYDPKTAFQLREPIRSELAAPITVGESVCGVLNVESTTTNAFGSDDWPFLEPYLALLRQPLTAGVVADDVHRTLTEMRKKQVLVLGKDTGDEYRYLLKIAESLRQRGYTTLLVKEFPDFRELSNEDKVRLFADVSRFVLIENSFPAGQIAECKICSTNRIVTAMLRERDRGSSYMVTDYARDFDFMNEFVYDDLSSLDPAVDAAAKWAEAKVEERGQFFDSRYPWRQK